MLLGSSMLELALGMIFFYFLLSILCSHINELIAGLFNRRGKDLIKGVQDLLNYPPATGNTSAPSEDLPDSASETMRLIKRHFDQNEFGDLLLLHPLIQGLATRSFLPWRRKHTPDYIPDHTFSLALIGTLLDLSDFLQQHGRSMQRAERDRQPAASLVAAGASAPTSEERALDDIRAAIQRLPDGPRRTLMPFLEGSADSIDELRANIESWYNAKMDRVSGVYKRRTQFWLLIIGLIATLLLNADSLSIATALWQHPTLRQAIAEQSRRAASASPAPSAAPGAEPSEQLRQIQQDVQQLLVFPIAWGKECAYNRWLGLTIRADAQGQPVQQPGRVAPFDQPNCRPQVAPLDLSAWTLKLIGFIITAVAISLGASFWFDLLRKVSNIRSSGPAPGEPSAVSSAQKPRGV
jgi:hypothetical protein